MSSKRVWSLILKEHVHESLQNAGWFIFGVQGSKLWIHKQTKDIYSTADNVKNFLNPVARYCQYALFFSAVLGIDPEPPVPDTNIFLLSRCDADAILYCTPSNLFGISARLWTIWKELPAIVPRLLDVSPIRAFSIVILKANASSWVRRKSDASNWILLDGSCLNKAPSIRYAGSVTWLLAVVTLNRLLSAAPALSSIYFSSFTPFLESQASPFRPLSGCLANNIHISSRSGSVRVAEHSMIIDAIIHIAMSVDLSAMISMSDTTKQKWHRYKKLQRFVQLNCILASFHGTTLVFCIKETRNFILHWHPSLQASYLIIFKRIWLVIYSFDLSSNRDYTNEDAISSFVVDYAGVGVCHVPPDRGRKSKGRKCKRRGDRSQ